MKGFWIPWATNGDEFRNHHLSITVDDRVIAYIWQKDDTVRYSNRFKFTVNASGVPGESRAGFDRRLVITNVGRSIGFYFESY